MLLSDRNLLVHHGGIYTQSYLKQRILTTSGLSRVFMDSLQIDEPYLAKRTNFLLRIARKITKTCKSALDEKVKGNEIALTASSKRALKLFDYWDNDEIVDG
jgi:hypothetical protein